MTTTLRVRRSCDDHLKHGQALLKKLNSSISAVDQSTFLLYSDVEKYGWTVIEDHPLEYNEKYIDSKFMPESMKQIFKKYELSDTMNDNHKIRLANDRAVVVDGRHRPKTSGEFGNIFNPELIIATYNYRPGHCRAGFLDMPIPKEVLTPLKCWSDVVFLQYQRQLSGNVPAMQRLRGVVRHKITNLETQETIQTAMRSRYPTFTVDDLRLFDQGTWFGMDSDQGAALLGTPNGQGVGQLLAEHKSKLGQKTIEGVTVYTPEVPSGGYALLFSFKDGTDESQMAYLGMKG